MEEKKKHKILLAEDDSNLGVLLCEYLQAKDYSADLAHDGEEAYNMFINDKYDLCIFDVMMPKKDGFTLAKEVRMANVEVPIVFLTARNVKEDILQGFKIGADDYLTKPFSMEELIMRIEAILRRTSGESPVLDVYKLGRFRFDTQKQQLIDGDNIIKLTTKESELLKLLCTNAIRCSSVRLHSKPSGWTTTISMLVAWTSTSPNCVSTSKTTPPWRLSTFTARATNWLCNQCQTI